MATPESYAQERRTRWSFAYLADNTWYWQKRPATGEPQRSARLQTLADALTDAMAHGYVAWSRTEERRRDSPEELLHE